MIAFNRKKDRFQTERSLLFLIICRKAAEGGYDELN